MSRLSLYLLGPPRIERDSEPIRVDTRKAVALLAYLSLSEESHGRDALVSLFWPESDPAHGRAALRRTLYALRRALAGSPQRLDPTAWLDADWETIGLVPQAEIWSDVGQFHKLLAQCSAHGHPGSDACPECVPLLTAAVDLHRGDFLSGFTLKDSYAFDDWQFFQAESLRRELADALERLVHAHIAQAAFGLALRYARQLLALDRLNEAAHCELMRLYAWSGQRSAALRQYHECVAILESQLGVVPQESTNDLYRAIMANAMPDPLAEGHSERYRQVSPASSEAQPSASAIGSQRRDPASWAIPRSEVKRPVTVIVADVGQSVSAGDADWAEDEADRTEELVRLARRVADRHGAQVDSSLAGRILAVFGVGHTHENDPELAVRAALEMRAVAERLGLRLAAGICTGEAHLRGTGPALGREHLWIGRAITNAAHLAREVQDGGILVAESTYYLTRQAFAFVSCASESAGRDGPRRCYRVLNVLPRSRKAWGLEGLRAALIGREGELALLCRALTQATAGHGQMVSLIGEAGVGKSRLVAELNQTALDPAVPGLELADATARPVVGAAPVPLWLEGRCLELSAGAGYAPYADILHQVFGWDARDAESRRYERITVAVQALVEREQLAPERADEIASVLGHFLSLPIADDWRERLDHEDPQRLCVRRSLALRDFLIALCRQQPVVLVFEDLHWADSLSVDLIAMLMEGLPRAALLLLCVYRPEHEHRCWHLATIAMQKCREAYTEITLRELTREQSRRMLESLLATASLPASVRDLILDQAQGNPLFIEEVVHALIETGAMRREGSTWLAQEDAALTAIPQSVQGVILSRVDALEEHLRHVLHVAAVIGRVFSRRVLADALGQDIELEQALWELEDRALIYQERTVPELEYSFKHVLTQETVYESIPAGRRSELHLRVAGSIETLYQESLGERDEQLAGHYEHAGNVEKAIAYLRLAAEKAQRTYANEEAIAHGGRALRLLATTPLTQERDQRELDLRIMLGAPLLYVRGHSGAEMESNYVRAYELCEHVGTTAQRSQVILGLRRFYFWRGQLLKAYPLAERFIAMAQEVDDPLQLAFAYPTYGETLYWLGDFEGCREYCNRGLEIYDPEMQPAYLATYGNDPGIGCWFLGGMAAWHLGDPDRALVMSQRAVDQAQAQPHPFVRAMALYHDGVVHRLRREAGAAREQMEALLAISGERRFALYRAWGLALHGWALAQEGFAAAGDAERGIEEIRLGIAALRAMGASIGLPSILASLAESLMRIGRLEEAGSSLDDALSHVQASGERSWEAELQRLRGELLLSKGDDDAAARCFRQALDTARGQQARSWELRAAVSLSRLWVQQGKGPEVSCLLEPVYDTFCEGFDTLDLREAGGLLAGTGARR